MQLRIARIERDGMLNNLDGFGQLAVEAPTVCAVVLQRRNEVRIELQHLQCLLLCGLGAAVVQTERGVREMRAG